MLVLTRKPGEAVVINGDIIIKVVEVRGNHVRLAFEAPRAVRIMRSELVDKDREHVREDGDPDLECKPAEWDVDAQVVAGR